MLEVSIHDQLACAERELSMRKNVYPGWVNKGRMSKGVAQFELAAMRAIVATLRRLDETERGQGKLNLGD